MKGKSIAEKALIEKGREDLYARLSAELKHAADDGAADQFIAAEHVVSQYLDAVGQGRDSLPDRNELAFACALLLVTTKTIEKRDLELLGRLSTMEIGISLFAMSDEIEEIRTRAIAGLDKLAGSTAPAGDLRRDTLPNDDVPF